MNRGGGVIFICGPGKGSSVLRLPPPVNWKCEDCGTRTFNRHKCDACLIEQAIADGLITRSGT